jgi:uncharacterized protein YoxC
MSKQEISDQQQLFAYQQIMPLFPQLFNDDVSVAIANQQKFIQVIPNSNLPINANVGDLVPDGGAVHDALISGKTVIREVPAKVYGVAFQSYAFPLINQKQTIGVLVVGKSLNRKQQILERAQNLTTALSQTTTAINEIATGAQSLNENNQDLAKTAEDTTNKMHDIQKVVSFIQSVSQKINMLGINAAIAAAHTSDSKSAGFGVIAQEIRKLSASTAKSVSEIEDVLIEIDQSVNSFSSKLTASVNTIGEQSAAAEQVLASMEELNETAKMMENVANSL